MSDDVTDHQDADDANVRTGGDAEDEAINDTEEKYGTNESPA